MKFLITGANGYIGSKVVKKLCDQGFSVVATDFDNQRIDKRAKFVKADIFERKEDWFTFFGKPDVCLHLAWRDGFIHNSKRHIEDLSSHFYFLTNLIDNGLQKIACMGTMHEVGYWVGKIDENTPCNPQSQYGIAKNALRKSLELYASQKQCAFLWLRAFYIFGDDSHGSSVFCKIRQFAEEGKTIFPFVEGKNQCDFISENDLCSQICSCLIQNKVFGIINCCSGKPVSLGEKVQWYIDFYKLPIKLDYGKFPDRPYDSPCIYGDNTKITKIMEGFKNE